MVQLAFTIIAFFVGLIGCSALLGPAKCNDGWASPSIGLRGACSWHGGVTHTGGLPLFAGLFLAFAVFHFIGQWCGKSRRESNEPSTRATSNSAFDEADHPPTGSTPEIVTVVDIADLERRAVRAGVPACPACYQPMIQRTAKRGRNRGSSFWGCRNYPECFATRTNKSAIAWIEAKRSEAEQ